VFVLFLSRPDAAADVDRRGPHIRVRTLSDPAGTCLVLDQYNLKCPGEPVGAAGMRRRAVRAPRRPARVPRRGP